MDELIRNIMKGNKLLKVLGVHTEPLTHIEGVMSGLGGFIGIASIYYVCNLYIYNEMTALFIIASMGSSAVLLFAAPFSTLTQPWNVLGGHLIAGFIGIACAKYISTDLIAAAASVGVSITAMYYARCTHPPAGATTLFAVIGGPSVHQLGYQLLITPILINVVIIIIVSQLFNLWRRDSIVH